MAQGEEEIGVDFGTFEYNLTEVVPEGKVRVEQVSWKQAHRVLLEKGEERSVNLGEVEDREGLGNLTNTVRDLVRSYNGREDFFDYVEENLNKVKGSVRPRSGEHEGLRSQGNYSAFINGETYFLRDMR